MSSQPETQSDLHVVLGASGAIGTAVVNELLSRGHRVRTVSRNGAAPTGATGQRGDISTVDGAVAACADAAVVYQCAQPKYADWAAEFADMTRTVIAGVEAAGAKLVQADNLYMYGAVDGPMTEDLPYAADFPKGRARAEVANLILAAHREGRIRATLGRASDYYGPGGLNTVNGATIFAAALKGATARWVGPLDVLHTVHYLPDIAAGLVTLGENETADGQAWHLPAPEALTGRDFLGHVYATLGTTPKIAGLGRGMQRIIGLFNPIVKELGETWYQRDRAFVSDASRYEKVFGPGKVTPFPEGVAATLDWFRANAA